MAGNSVTDTARALRRHRLRIRTVAVSFGAAVRSARRDLEVSAGERDALIEAWRAWTLAALDRYAQDAQRLTESADAEEEGDCRALHAALAAAEHMVRGV